MKTIRAILFYGVAAFYVFMMFDLFFRFSYIFEVDRIVTRSYNLIPFQTIWEYGYRDSRLSFADVNLYGNVMAFVPYGIYLGVIKKRKEFARGLLVVLATSIAIEAIQFAFGLGACDIDDVILNTLGGALGLVLYRLARKICKGEDRAKTVITAVAFFVGVPIIVWYFATVYNHLRL
ncbi:VanZ family protein [Ruminococcaceae bacterium OttesenSCG-928-L11]|nr:VanZ family protein [Ruminococcaceae bacterium OttesenSCG-928-L11]